MTQLRFTEDQIDFEVPHVIETLRTVARRLGAMPDALRLGTGPDA
jgi:hypothetical protein